MLTKSIPLELKSLTDTGQFSGYGSVFGNVDFGGDIVEAGAFGKSLETINKSGAVVPVLWQHKTDTPIGNWTNLKEDAHGLLGDADLWLDDAPNARVAYKGMKTKTITGLSIGYRVKRDSYDKKTGFTTLHELDLVEISVVTNPMNDIARVGAVKSLERMLKEGGLPTLSQFEDFLREAGFSKSQAAAVAGSGLSKLLSRGEPGGETKQVLAALAAFKLTQ